MTRRTACLLAVAGLAGRPLAGDAAPAAPGAGGADDTTVYFARWSAAIDADGAATLRGIAERLRASPGARASIAGYADTIGDVETNLRVAAARAVAVRDWLAGHGIPAGRLTLAPAAEADGSGPSGGNRRAVVTIVR